MVSQIHTVTYLEGRFVKANVESATGVRTPAISSIVWNTLFVLTG